MYLNMVNMGFDAEAEQQGEHGGGHSRHGKLYTQGEGHETHESVDDRWPHVLVAVRQGKYWLRAGNPLVGVCQTSLLKKHA